MGNSQSYSVDSYNLPIPIFDIPISYISLPVLRHLTNSASFQSALPPTSTFDPDTMTITTLEACVSWSGKNGKDVSNCVK